MKSLNEFVAQLPDVERSAISEGYKKLHAKEARLRELRETIGLSQSEIARRLNVKQPRISKIERRLDSIEALKEYISALGGTLELIAAFGDVRMHVNCLADVEKAEDVAFSRWGRLSSQEIKAAFIAQSRLDSWSREITIQQDEISQLPGWGAALRHPRGNSGAWNDNTERSFACAEAA